MSLNTDLVRLADEHEDLAAAIDEVLKPVGETVNRMRWKGPHRDRVLAELAAMRRTVGTVVDDLRRRARLLRHAAATIPDDVLVGHPVFIHLPELREQLLKERDELLKNLRRQLTPMGSVVSEVLARHGAG